MKEEVEQLINYAVKNGYIDDSAVEWSDNQKEDYYNKCQMYG